MTEQQRQFAKNNTSLLGLFILFIEFLNNEVDDKEKYD